MKKTLAIVLALVMVLAMIPAMSAHVTEYKTVTDKSYKLGLVSNNVNAKETVTYAASVEKGNSITLEYKWSDLKADFVDKFAEDVVMGEVQINGWDVDVTGGTTKSVTVDGKVLAENAADGWICFPIELTKAGYTDTFVVTVVAEKDNKQITETAKVSIKLVNTETYKAAKTAYITNIASTTNDMSAYIVGDKIYLDLVNKSTTADVKFTFADENKAAFTAITYVKDIPTVFDIAGKDEDKLVKSAYTFDLIGAASGTIADGSKIKFALETKDAEYTTKEYVLKVRTDIKPEDPKGIYFAETTKTIAMGESFAPVVVGVKTGKPVAANILVPADTDKEVIDVVNNVVVGTREGVAYITATYTVPGSSIKYDASSMKVIVTLPGESIPAVDPAAEVYYVTCRALNVRAGAGTSYKKVDLIHRGDAVKVVELKNGWAKLDNGTYVCAKYIAK